MRVIVDCRWIFSDLSGVGIYTRELIREYAAIDHGNEYIMLFQDPYLRDRTTEHCGLRKSDWVETRIIPYGIFDMQNQFQLPRAIGRMEADIFHTTNYMAPLKAFPKKGAHPTKCIVTIHDLIPMVLKDHAPRSKKTRLYPIYRKLMHEIGSRADGIISVSEASRYDILEHLHIPKAKKDKVISIYNGISASFQPQQNRSADDAIQRILYVGRMDPYKKIMDLLSVFNELVKEGRQNLELHIVGREDERYPEAKNFLAENDLEKRVHWEQQISDDALLKAYQNATVLVHPSSYEGFGLPVAEAMACGTPVICTNASSLPEVAGSAALMYCPGDTQKLKLHLCTVLDKPNTALELTHMGLEQSKIFNWHKTAEETLAFYASVCSSEE